MKGDKMAGMALFIGALVLLVLATVLVFFEKPPVVDTSAQEQVVSRIESAVSAMAKAQENKNKELDIVDQNLLSQIQAVHHRLNHLEGKLDAAENFKGLLEAMMSRPVRVILPKQKPVVNYNVGLVDRAMKSNPPSLKPPKLLRKKK